jgi:hypothetical protein
MNRRGLIASAIAAVIATLGLSRPVSAGGRQFGSFDALANYLRPGLWVSVQDYPSLQADIRFLQSYNCLFVFIWHVEYSDPHRDPFAVSFPINQDQLWYFAPHIQVALHYAATEHGKKQDVA